MLRQTVHWDLPAHLRMSEDQTTELAGMFRLMSDPTRLIQTERRGNRVFYLITDEHIRRVLSDMVESLPEVDGE